MFALVIVFTSFSRSQSLFHFTHEGWKRITVYVKECACHGVFFIHITSTSAARKLLTQHALLRLAR